MRKSFVINIFFLLLVNLVIKPVWIFGIDVTVQNRLGHEIYGQYQALLSLSIIFQIVLDFGLQNYNNRTIAQSPRVLNTLFPNIVIAKGVLALAYFLIIIGTGFLMGYRSEPLFLLALLSFVQILNSFLLFLRSNVSGLQEFKKDSLLSVSDKFFMIAICGILLFNPYFSPHFKIEWFVYAQIASYLLSSLIALFIVRKLSSLQWGTFKIKKTYSIIKKSLPFATIIFLMGIYVRIDVLMIERLLSNGKEQAGVFAASFRLLDVANNVSGVLFAGILLPLFGRLLAKRESVVPIVKVSINLLLPLSLTLMLTSYFLGSDIMMFIYSNATSYDGMVFSFLMIAFPGYCIGYVYSTLLVANGNLRQLIYLSLIAVVFNLVLNIILIPRFGALGAAISAAATQMVIAFTNISMAQKILKLKFDIKWILQYFMFVLFILTSIMLILNLAYPLFLSLVLIGISCLIWMTICGFVPLSKIKELLLKNI